jgi:hypothetical protein
LSWTLFTIFIPRILILRIVKTPTSLEKLA